MPRTTITDGDGRYPLDRGFVRFRIMRQIIDGWSLNKLAAEYGVAKTTITDFKRKYAQDIERLRESVNDEMQGLWVASKFNRIAEYQQTLEDIEDTMGKLLSVGTVLGPGDMALIKEKRNLLRQVAEELGQLPNRNQVQIAGASVSYHFDGVDPSDVS